MTDDAEEATAAHDEPPHGLKATYARRRAQVEDLLELAATTAWAPVVLAREAYQRDRDIGGAVLAGAIAFRVFVWLLAATVLAVAGLGFLSAAGQDPAEASSDLGITAFAASSVAQAADDVQRSRWVLLALGLWALYSASKHALRSVWVTSALVWRVPMTKPPTIAGVLGYNAAFLTMIATTAAASRLRDLTPGPGLGVTLAVVLVFGLIMWVGLHRLPRPSLPFTAVLPGAALLAVGLQLMHLVSIFYLPHLFESSSETYGSLGAAVAMLLWLYVFGRLVVFAGVLNATLWERYHEGGDAPDLVGAGDDPVMAAGLALARDLRARAGRARSRRRRDRRESPERA
ncbi:MAG: YihY/virulence factor BrkB family protein, partial [Acidimicrobiales bacterium]|nr:YihY/virulence factor BrkB family protein [Acidimicrobiales bacterium]MCB1014077.1 YihY/virulence factor BrkB family protein [Acidimicrobiales bacterium]MCB9373190.1 YihY/virulence factor BrkB family protein [Microthrixaceae bacterium]